MDAFRDSVRRALRKATAYRAIRVVLRKLTLTGRIPPGIWKRLPIEATFTVVITPDSRFRYSSVANDQIGRALYWRGWKGYEPETVEPFYRFARTATRVLDIGANTGFYSLLACAANPLSEVISFEPLPRVYERLVTNIRANGWEHRCCARCEAVSNVEGMARFHVPAGDVPVSGSLSEKGFRGYTGELIDVRVTAIDAVCCEGRVDLVKIDAENFENRVLEGMQHVLAASRPEIIVECNVDGPFSEVQEILKGFDYRFFHLRSDGPEPVDRIVPDPTGRFRNFLCISRNSQGNMG
mgnify:CR=1 FL=1